MATGTLKIGTLVNYLTNSTTNYMKNGVVTGLSGDRAFVNWPQHGSSSIPIKSLVPQPS